MPACFESSSDHFLFYGVSSLNHSPLHSSNGYIGFWQLQKISLTKYPFFLHWGIRRAYRSPLNVVANAKLSRRRTSVAISWTIKRSALNAAIAGSKGESPSAIRSTLINLGQSASFGRNSRAKVVLPAPFGPSRITTFFFDDCAFLARDACYPTVQ